ncbi:MAG: SPOR domain-containing protein [Bacteroidales bacterium]|nr:SPOR domain-containing protein [Bacteroidales bacterium]
MKKSLHILLPALCLLLAAREAAAQWYLFPGMRQHRDTTRQESFLPPEDDRDAADTLQVSVILPLRSDGTPSSNFLQFYTGVLAAADSLAAGGTAIALYVHDAARENAVLPVRQLAQSDLVIGPVGVPEMRRCTEYCPNQYFISPLEPKAAELTDSCRVVQAPAAYDDQLDELVRWLLEDWQAGDRLVFLQNGQEAVQEASLRFQERLTEAGLIFSEAPDPSEFLAVAGGCTRYVLPASAEEYCANAVREIALERMRGLDVVLYGTSRLRSSGNVEEESLRQADARITASYAVEKGNAAMQAFSERYLRRFKAEPGSFALQGYDVTYYFISLYRQYGPGWFNQLPFCPGTGLQSDFRFLDVPTTGQANRAVRRVRYRAGTEEEPERLREELRQEASAPDSVSVFDKFSHRLIITQEPEVRKALEQHVFNNAMRMAQGLEDQCFCIRIYFDNSQNAREKSMQEANRFKALFPGIPVLRNFSASFFKVTVGEYNSRAEAQAALKRIKNSFPSAFIVRK